MLKNTTYQEKFAILAPWMPSIIESIKKDIKNEHLKKDAAFFRHYFQGKNIAKLVAQELAPAYSHAIAHNEKAEELAEFVSNRWLLKHSDLYHYFEQELTKVAPNFSELEVLDTESSLNMMEKAIQQFGAPATYLFCVINSVVFPKEVYDTLRQRAEHHVEQSTQELAAKQEQMAADSMQNNYELQIARMTDKYEKKILGLQKKYTQDVESLKKQIVALQRKLQGS